MAILVAKNFDSDSLTCDSLIALKILALLFKINSGPSYFLPPLPPPPIPKQVKKMRRDDCFDRILSYANTLTYRKFAVTCVFKVYHYRVISKDFSGTGKSFRLACSFTLFLRQLRGCSYSICQREMNVNDLKIAALCQVNYWFILLPA